MQLAQNIAISSKAIVRHKMRTILIELALLVGIATLTVVVSLTQGANKRIMHQIHNFGPDAIMVHAGGGKMRGPSTVDQANLSRKDLQDIRNIPGVQLATPFQVSLDMPIKHGSAFTTAWVMGVEPDWQNAWRRGAAKGAFISYSDNEQLARVCVIGTSTAKEIFANDNPIGADININNVSFKVIGILEKRGQSPAGTDFDNLVLIPYSTASRRLMNQPLYSSMIRVLVSEIPQAEKIAHQIATVLRHNHKLSATEENDFRISTAAHVAKMIRKSAKTMGLFLWCIAIIAPLVGGIVLMNIMLMAVSERKREIGLRRALGAKKKHIIQQFLTESVLLTFSGGLLGVGAGVALALFLQQQGKPISISWQSFAIAFVLSVLIGLFFGVYPARKAANQDPVEALNG